MSLGPRLFCSYCSRWVVSFKRKKGNFNKFRFICPLCCSDIDLDNQSL